MPRRIVGGTLALSILSLMLLLPSAAYAADSQSCQVLSWTPNYPGQVSVGQTIQVTSTINVACAQWRTYYSARVDLMDRSSDRLFSTSTFQIGWQPDVNATVANEATAPQTGGEWMLQLNLYIFEEAGMVGSPFKDAFNINVTDNNSSTQSAATAASTAIQGQAAPNASSIMPQTTVAAISTDSAPARSGYVAAILAVASLLGLTVLVARSKRHK